MPDQLPPGRYPGLHRTQATPMPGSRKQAGLLLQARGDRWNHGLEHLSQGQVAGAGPRVCSSGGGHPGDPRRRGGPGEETDSGQGDLPETGERRYGESKHAALLMKGGARRANQQGALVSADAHVLNTHTDRSEKNAHTHTHIPHLSKTDSSL